MDGVPMTIPLVFTTRGWLHPSLVRMVPNVTQDDDNVRVVQVDKYLAETGEWLGNDAHVHVKRWPEGIELFPGRAMAGG